jgi:hypothetical protein
LYSPLKNSICLELALFLAYFPSRCLMLARWLTGSRCAPAFASTGKHLDAEKRPAANLNGQACEMERSGLTLAQAEEWLDWLENNESTSSKVTWRKDE